MGGEATLCRNLDWRPNGRQLRIHPFPYPDLCRFELVRDPHITSDMDGWGANEKYPHALGGLATSINRRYLKMKSELLPYMYSVEHEAVNGMPIVRAMFLEYLNRYMLGKAT